MEPIRELWVIGEGFLRSTFGTLQTLRTEPQQLAEFRSQSHGQRGKLQKCHPSIPYIYKNFKVKPFYQPNAGDARGTLYKLYQSLVQALNKQNKLPDYIVMLIDRDIILQLDYFKPGVKYILEWCIGCPFKQKRSPKRYFTRSCWPRNFGHMGADDQQTIY